MENLTPHHFAATPPFAPMTSGSLRVRIADSPQDVIAAQRLRYAIFYHELGATLPTHAQNLNIDADEFDTICDHMLVEDFDATTQQFKVVGTYRLLRGSEMPKLGRFYTESEFDIAALKKHPLDHLLELGRSCVKAEYRSKAVMQLLWRGIGEYVTYYNITLMFGCASFTGSNHLQHAECLSYLHHFHRAPAEICPQALPKHYINMHLMEKDAIDVKRAFMNLPVLIKGYLRLGGSIGDGAMEDKPFNTTDVSVVVNTDTVGQKYVSRYAPDKK